MWLRPVSKKTDDFLALFEGFDETFIQALEARDDLPPQERDLWDLYVRHQYHYLFNENRPKIIAERVSQLLPNDRLVMSFITYAELIKGAFGSQNYEQSIRAIELLTERVNVLYPNEQICLHYGKWANTLKKQGRPIGNNDLWIACHALSLNAVIIT